MNYNRSKELFQTPKLKGNKQFQCNLCSRSFKTVYNLYNHQKKIHTLQPYNCAWCQESFDSKEEQILHQRKVHLGLTMNEILDSAELGLANMISKGIITDNITKKVQEESIKEYQECEIGKQIKQECEEVFVYDIQNQQQNQQYNIQISEPIRSVIWIKQTCGYKKQTNNYEYNSLKEKMFNDFQDYLVKF